MMRIVQSEPELSMLEEIENKFAPTKYTAKPGMYVNYITAEVCRQIHVIYIELGLDNASTGRPAEDSGARVLGQKAKRNTNITGGGEPDHKRLKGGTE